MSVFCTVAKVLAVALIATGAAGFCMALACGALHWAVGPCISSWLELPTDPVFAAVDGQGRIFVYSPNYQRMQVYSPDGGFLIGWFMWPNGYVTGFNSANSSITVVYRDDTTIEFNVEGRVLNQEKQPGMYSSGARWREFFVCADGIDCTRFQLKHRLAWPQITRTDAEGERVIVGQPLPISLISVPFPCVLVGLSRNDHDTAKQTVAACQEGQKRMTTYDFDAFGNPLPLRRRTNGGACAKAMDAVQWCSGPPTLVWVLFAMKAAR